MKKYLVPLDGSETGEAALPWAKFLAKDEEVRIELLRCYHPLASVYSYPDFATPPPVPYDLSGFVRHAEKYLKVVAKEHDLGEVKTTVREGDAAQIILEQSETDDVDAILMSSHGRGGIGRWLLGSVATKIVRASRKPVFIVRPRKDGKQEPTLKKILVCLDGSELAEKALKPALALGKRHDAEVVFFRGVEFTPYPVANIQEALMQEVKESEAYVEELAARYPDCNITTRVKTTQIVSGILEAAKDCDLVVLTSHGHGGFERWLLGSVAEKVLHRTKTPMLVCFGKE
jgi:nucleotide-binding universal stress UspA family protein